MRTQTGSGGSQTIGRIQGGSSAGLEPAVRRAVLWLGGGALLSIGVAGGLLWWRDGERVFTEGLISAIARCF